MNSTDRRLLSAIRSMWRGIEVSKREREKESEGERGRERKREGERGREREREETAETYGELRGELRREVKNDFAFSQVEREPACVCECAKGCACVHV